MIRQYGGLAPFCSIPESSTTSWAPVTLRPRSATPSGSKEAMRKGIGEDGEVIAVIGDGALTGGVAYESAAARRRARDAGRDRPQRQRDVDLAERRGALPYFNRVRLNPRLFHAREDVEERLTKLPMGLGRRIERLGPGQVCDQGLLGARALLRGARPRLHGRDRRPRCRRPALGAAPGARRRAPGRRPHPHRQGQGLRRRRGGRARGDGGVARRQARLHRRPQARRPIETRAEAGRPGPGVRQRSRLDRPEKLEEATPKPVSARVHVSVRRRADRRGRARQARDRHHRGDGGGTGLDKLAKALPGQYYDVGIARQDAVLFASGLALQGRSRSARSTRPSCSAASTRSSTTSACRTST